MRKLQGHSEDIEKADAQRKARRSGGGMRKLPQKKSFIFLCPPHKSMDGYLWVEKITHWVGKTFNCNNGLEHVLKGTDKPDNCFICNTRVKAYRAAKKAGEEGIGKVLAEKTKQSRNRISNSIDMSPMFNASGSKIIEEEIPDCFLDHEVVSKKKPKKCKKCSFVDSCKEGIVPMKIPVKVKEEILGWSKKNNNQEMDNTKNAICVMIDRVGTGMKDTNYDATMIDDLPFIFPKSVRIRIKNKLVDILNMYPSVNNKEMKEIYDSSDEETDEETLPECFGTEKHGELKECRTCPVFADCKKALKVKASDEEEDEEDDDEEDEELEKGLKKQSKSKKEKDKKKSKKKSKKKKVEEEEEEEEEEEDERDEEEEEDNDSDEDEEEENEDEEEDEEEDDDDDDY